MANPIGNNTYTVTTTSGTQTIVADTFDLSTDGTVLIFSTRSANQNPADPELLASQFLFLKANVTTVAYTGPSGGAGGYTLGGALAAGNVVLGAGAGAGASLVSIVGLDGNHAIIVLTGTTPAANSTILTLTYTTSRGHATQPILSADDLGQYTALGQVPVLTTPLATSYVLTSGATALTASTGYRFNLSCP